MQNTFVQKDSRKMLVKLTQGHLNITFFATLNSLKQCEDFRKISNFLFVNACISISVNFSLHLVIKINL